ncbi:MAG: hypothetical protein LHW46_06365 [Candidatus Cloacimonetes bacterium]|jgi:hypothetical protein|nr:hypothetical protein [Candidatus Cloacimonadota bacterium]
MAINHASLGMFHHEWQDIEQQILGSKLHEISHKILIEPEYTASEEEEDQVNFKVALKLLDVPCRADQSKCRNIDIYLESKVSYRIISRKQKEIIEYHTKVQYCKRDNKNLTCIMGYRYDGDATATQYGHPIFHMHFKTDVLYQFILDLEKDKFNVIKLETQERDEIRIPTAQMDVINTFVSIFADHAFSDASSLELFQPFLEDVEPFLTSCNTKKDKLYKDGPQTDSCHSNRWYPISI